MTSSTWEGLVEDLVPLHTQLVTPALAEAFDFPSQKAAAPSMRTGQNLGQQTPAQTASLAYSYQVRHCARIIIQLFWNPVTEVGIFLVCDGQKFAILCTCRDPGLLHAQAGALHSSRFLKTSTLRQRSLVPGRGSQETSLWTAKRSWGASKCRA